MSSIELKISRQKYHINITYVGENEKNCPNFRIYIISICMNKKNV